MLGDVHRGSEAFHLRGRPRPAWLSCGRRSAGRSPSPYRRDAVGRSWSTCRGCDIAGRRGREMVLIRAPVVGAPSIRLVTTPWSPISSLGAAPRRAACKPALSSWFGSVDPSAQRLAAASRNAACCSEPYFGSPRPSRSSLQLLCAPTGPRDDASRLCGLFDDPPQLPALFPLPDGLEDVSSSIRLADHRDHAPSGRSSPAVPRTFLHHRREQRLRDAEPTSRWRNRVVGILVRADGGCAPCTRKFSSLSRVCCEQIWMAWNFARRALDRDAILRADARK